MKGLRSGASTGLHSPSGTFARVCVLCLVSLLARTDAVMQGSGLFSAAEPLVTQSSPPESRPSSPSADPTTIRSRLVRIDFGQLRTARAAAGRSAATAASLTLNLFDDAVYSATVERVVPTASGYALTGRLDGVPLGTLTLVVNGSAVAGTVRTPAATYTIRSAGNGLYVVREVDLSQLAPEAEPLPPPPAGTNLPGPPGPEPRDAPPPPEGAALLRAVPPHAGRSLSGVRRQGPAPASSAARAGAVAAGVDPRVAATQTDDGSVIDVIAFYTPGARQFAGGTADVETLIDLRVIETNQAYADSGVIQRINLVFREEVDYTEAGNIQTDLERLSEPSDGYFDHVHALRDVYAADIVHLFEDRAVSDDTGIAWDMREVSHEFESEAFSVSNVRAENILFAHELGHNMGLNHDRFEQDWVGKLAPDHPDNNKPYPYSYGYVNQRMFEPGAAASTRWRTIMAYPWQCHEQLHVYCAPILRFSNADQTWEGDPLGMRGDAPSSSVTGPSDAQRSLDATRVTVANFRPSTDRTTCTYRTTPDGQLALSAGGTFRIDVTARPGCAWTAASNDPFLSVTSGESGTGRGTVTYTVTANSGARREGTLTIAGDTVAVNQIGPSTPGICTRARQVHEAVVRHRGLDHCWEVTSAHLGFIKRFSVIGRGLTSLQASDLAGLTHLEELNLWENHLRELPADLFAGSPRLRYIALSDNHLETLPAGIFAGLTDLEELWLTRNRLALLPAGIFAGLTNLKELSLNENQLTLLPAGAFTELTRLEELFLGYNRLTALPAGAFGGLSRLTTLWLHNNELAAIPSGAFAGLVSLKDLALGENQLTALPAGIFAGLVNLEELGLAYNEIAELPADAFAGLARLREVRLYHNRLTTVSSDAFSDLANLERLLISNNELGSLPAGLFAGLSNLRALTLHNNPGAPFPLVLRLERTDAAAATPGPATLSVNVNLGAPFETRIGVAAEGGTLSPATAKLARGDVWSNAVTVTQAGGAPVTVQVRTPPVVPSAVRGLRTIAGRPLVLFGPPGGSADYDTDDDDLIEVTTLAQLDALRYDPDGDGLVEHAANWSAYTTAYAGGSADMGCANACLGYELAADLDFDTNGNGRTDSGDTYWNGGAGWTPIGETDSPFTAIFEGNGHTIVNLSINRSGRPGLFGTTSRLGTIRHVGLIDARVMGDFAAGALVGYNEGIVTGSYATGRVQGSSAGGLVGVNSGTISRSYSTCRVTGDEFVGGLVGSNAGTVTGSYATGRAAGKSVVGGLVGENVGTVTASYATGPVSAANHAGGLVGHNGGSIAASYWDMDTSGRSIGRTTGALQGPTDYSGLYQRWNVDLDGNGAGDAPWDFGASSQYPVLVADMDGNGQATWQEFGQQLREGPTLAVTSQVGPAAVRLAWDRVNSHHWTPAPGVSYRVFRGDGAVVAEVLDEFQYIDLDVALGDTHAYQVAAVVQGGEATRSGRVTVTVTGGDRLRPSAAFTDHPIQPGVTPVRAIHFLELRARIDALRGRENLPAFAWTDRALRAGVTPIRRVHLRELRAALDEAYAAAGRRRPRYTDANVTAGRTLIRAVHLMELRGAVAALE